MCVTPLKCFHSDFEQRIQNITSDTLTAVWRPGRQAASSGLGPAGRARGRPVAGGRCSVRASESLREPCGTSWRCGFDLRRPTLVSAAVEAETRVGVGRLLRLPTYQGSGATLLPAQVLAPADSDSTSSR
jgi:hypothetical protein